MILSWSGGKDSYCSLLRLEEKGRDFEVLGLLTTLSLPYRRVSMHGTREHLLDLQARAVGLPLLKCWIPADCDNQEYMDRFADTVSQVRKEDLYGIAFGDLYLQDIRKFREQQMHALGLHAVFPLWHTPTSALAKEFIECGHRATITAVDAQQIEPSCLGSAYDHSFLRQLDPKADPCGENGEFHTFVWLGARMKAAVISTPGETKIHNGRFHFLDLIPNSSGSEDL